jgi:hypothetical protein
MNFPLKHLSVRVPWHDAGWSGVVCKAPHLNGACSKLTRIAEHKCDEEELKVAGLSLHSLEDERQWPPCVDERATFMAPFEMTHTKRHALAAKNPKNYGHFIPTKQRYPAFSAGVVPFLWMMRPNLNLYAEQFNLDLDEGREPELGYKSHWVHESTNQKNLLTAFAGHLRVGQSLSFFYAKHVPFVEGTDRIIVGVGKVKVVGDLSPYDTKAEGPAGMIWERPVQHSIRPKGGEGFLMPFDELIKRAEEDPSVDIERYMAKAPSEHWAEFSYASELVGHDGAISAMLSIDGALLRMEQELGIPTAAQREWIHQELITLWKVRGPFPGLGAVLSAFGLSRGLFIGHALQEKAGENADPWPLVDKAFESPADLQTHLQKDFKELKPVWKGLPAERRTFLQLLSRFELTADQAKIFYEESTRNKKGLAVSDQEVIRNPYRLYEVSRHSVDCVQLLTIDRGVFPDEVVRNVHPLEEPSALESALDIRRVRAFAVAELEKVALLGHTLLSVGDLVEAIAASSVKPACNVTGDIITARLADLAPELYSVPFGASQGVRLTRYKDIATLVNKQVMGRVKAEPQPMAIDWAALIDAKFGEPDPADLDEVPARQEKSAALKVLAESRFSVLAGPAGAGKTTVLAVLCAQPRIQEGGILLLAPTGKARVRMQELVGDYSIAAMTIAQFLLKNGRYDGKAGRYHLSNAPKTSSYKTIVVDESSMLTEDMFGAIFDALQGVDRYIFVGDPSQLPPIGAGRPFVDIINKLRPENSEAMFPRIGLGYAELTKERRQGGSDRPDLRLARWFSSSPPAPWDDDIFSSSEAYPELHFVQWNNPEDFQVRLAEVLVDELHLESKDDVRGFNASLGSAAKGEYDYFNATRNGEPGSVMHAERWQILSPLKGMPFGCGDINRFIHEKYRQSFLELASKQWQRPIPKPMGAERIVYGDKVINVVNDSRVEKRIWPKEGGLNYLANGEVGIAVGQWSKAGKSSRLKVEFTSQKGFTYDFYASDFNDEGASKLELAYALTVHKAQGSQFNTVILVLPEAHPLLSRELIYTALTRHQDRVVIMHQGSRSLLRDFSAPHRSEAAQRKTSLMQDCEMMELPQAKGSLFMQKGLVHTTADGVAVRSKSELVIYTALVAAGQQPVYEKPLALNGTVRYPDFTLEDEISGKTIYWEHLGMLDREDYRKAWEKKLQWYRDNGVLTLEDGGGEAGTLVTSTESPEAGLDMTQIQTVIEQVFN